MSFGISRGVAVDDAGNVQANVWVDVRRMAPGFPHVIPLYASNDGSATTDWPDGTMDNPFFCPTGEWEFYHVAGLDRVRVYKAGFDKTWDNVPVGNAQAADIDAYATAGFTWAPESATSTPPSAGCIRFDTDDVSTAEHVYLDRDTLGGSDAATWLSSLGLGDWLLLSTGVGIEVGWPVLSVSHDTTGGDDYFDINVDQTNYAGPAGPLSFGDSGFVTVAQQRQASSNAGTEVVIETAGTYAVSSTTSKVYVALAGSGTVDLTLGKTSDRGGLPLAVFDLAGNATIILTADAADTGGINGASTAQINSSGAGFGLAGGATFYPKASLNAWAGIA